MKEYKKYIIITISLMVLILFSGCSNTYKYNSFGEIKELDKAQFYQVQCYYWDTYDNIKSQNISMCTVNMGEVSKVEFEKCNVKYVYEDKYVCDNLNGTTKETQEYYRGVWN